MGKNSKFDFTASSIEMINTNYTGIAEVLKEIRLLYESEKANKKLIDNFFERFIGSPTMIIKDLK